MNKPKLSKPIVFTFLCILLVGISLSLYALQHQQIFQQFAWTTEQSALTQCSPDGTAVIVATFSNTEADKDMNVIVSDIQTGATVDMRTVKAQEQKSANIVTNKKSLAKGSVIFHLTWTDGSKGTDQFSASYNAINDCPVPTVNFCPDTTQNGQGTCSWDPIPDAKGYNVVVKETDNGAIIQAISLSPDATQSAFPMTPGVPYVCTVTPTNECGGGTPAQSSEKICTVPTPTPTSEISPTPTLSPTPSTAVSISPSPVLSPTETPVPTQIPTATPAPTATPVPTAKPTPHPTPSPVVVIITQPPQQVVITSPPKQTIVRIPGQTQTIVQQLPPQTVVVTQPPQPTAKPYSPVTPVPTVPPTGNTTPTVILVGTSAFLLIAGGIVFFLL
ncbi:MAG TPA: hypothetical protein VLF89_08665 [Candidatus Saccharimonadales bacterium]|nr:hypothetical protein [Candidatus Saccharimonadales bacterium]